MPVICEKSKILNVFEFVPINWWHRYIDHILIVAWSHIIYPIHCTRKMYEILNRSSPSRLFDASYMMCAICACIREYLRRRYMTIKTAVQWWVYYIAAILYGKISSDEGLFASRSRLHYIEAESVPTTIDPTETLEDINEERCIRRRGSVWPKSTLRYVDFAAGRRAQ